MVTSESLRPTILFAGIFLMVGTLGTDAEAAIDRYYSTPQQYYVRAEQLNLPLQKFLRIIWGSADKSPAHL